jgi:choline dehydrogenase-like flavoprotein
MSRIDGRSVTSPLDLRADVVVVGSGPAGAAAAREAARRGASVIVVEAGRWFEPHEFPLASFDAMALLYRGMSATVVVGSAPIPFVQGKMVGGSSPINGAICWRLPRDVHAAWLHADPALEEAMPWDELEAATDEVEARLGVAPTDPAIAGRKNELMAVGAEALGLEHRPTRRNVRGCDGSGRCMQGCPKARKQSVDLTLLADAGAAGARVVSSVEVDRIDVEAGVAVGVTGTSDGGARVRVRADRVIVAASAVQSPALLLRSGLADGPVGAGFQCHPGVSMMGRWREHVRMWEGATQGHEVIGLRGEGLKFEALGFGLGVMAGRLDGVGRGLSREIADMSHRLDWGVAVRAEARGRVRVVGGRPVVLYQPTARDVAKMRRGLRVLGEMMLAAGADYVSPGVKGFAERVDRVADLERLEREGPRGAGAFTAAITHMFGTCAIGSDPRASVVRPDFRHHAIDRLYVADSSVFPTNVGVNPQIPIMAVATLCARRALEEKPRGRTMEKTLTLEDLMAMDTAQLRAVMARGHALDPEVLAGRQYLGVDLSMPGWARKLLWHTFRKTFVRDDATGDVRGWNVRMEQHGIDGARIPMRDRRGNAITFGHYRVRSAAGVRFPRGWAGGSFLDYTTAGNAPLDPAGLAYTPLVQVNAGSHDLLLGWEIFKLGPALLPVPLYWALRYEGPVDVVVAPPRDSATRAAAPAAA